MKGPTEWGGTEGVRTEVQPERRWSLVVAKGWRAEAWPEAQKSKAKPG